MTPKKENDVLAQEYKYLTMQEAAEKIGGSVLWGDKNYPLYGMTAIGSAKDFELCVASTDEAVSEVLASDAEAVLTDADHVSLLPESMNVLVADDVPLAADILANCFRNL